MYGHIIFKGKDILKRFGKIVENGCSVVLITHLTHEDSVVLIGKIFQNYSSVKTLMSE